MVITLFILFEEATWCRYQLFDGAKIGRIAENNKGKTINQRMIFPKSIGGNSRNKIVVSFIC